MRPRPSIRRTSRPVMPDNVVRWCFESSKKVSVGVAAQHSSDAGDAATRTSLDAERRAEWISAWWCGYA